MGNEDTVGDQVGKGVAGTGGPLLVGANVGGWVCGTLGLHEMVGPTVSFLRASRNFFLAAICAGVQGRFPFILKRNRFK